LIGEVFLFIYFSVKFKDMKLLFDGRLKPYPTWGLLESYAYG